MTQKRESKEFVSFLWNDIKRGMLRNKIKYIIAFLFALVCVYTLSKVVRSFQQMGTVTGTAGFFDNILYMVLGIPEYVPQKGTMFKLPYLWMVINVLPAFLVYSYAVKDTEDMGMYILLKYKSRSAWWMSKCIWNIVSVCSMYVLIWITVFCSSWILNHTLNGMWTLNEDICINIMEIATPSAAQSSHIHNGTFLIAILFLPLLVGIGMSLIQMAFSLAIGPVLSFAMVLAVYVFSAYFMNPAWIGNYTMLIRNRMILGTDGMYVGAGIAIAAVIGITGVIFGFFYFKKMDIFGKE